MLFIFNSFYSCQNKELTASEILSNSLDFHGGYNNWKRIDSLSFNKKTTLYTEAGEKEKEIYQFQSFHFGNSINGQITVLGTDTIVYRNQKDVYSKNIRDSIVLLTPSEEESIKTLFRSAYYVVSQPFNLKESNASLRYKKDTVIDGNTTHIVDVSYTGDDKDSDQWSYFFDAQTFKVISCRVFHSPTISFITNTSFDTNTPFVFNTERESSFLKKDGTKDYVRATYLYSDYRVVYKEEE